MRWEPTWRPGVGAAKDPANSRTFKASGRGRGTRSPFGTHRVRPSRSSTPRAIMDAPSPWRTMAKRAGSFGGRWQQQATAGCSSGGPGKKRTPSWCNSGMARAKCRVRWGRTRVWSRTSPRTDNDVDAYISRIRPMPGHGVHVLAPADTDSVIGYANDVRRVRRQFARPVANANGAELLVQES